MRRAPGEGSISRRKDGRWQAAIQQDGKRTVLYARTRAEVAAKLASLREAARRSGRLPHPGPTTLGEYLADWLEAAQLRLRPTTMNDYAVLVSKHIAPALGTVRLSGLDPLRLARFEAELARKVSPRRARQAHDLLHKALGDAVRLGLLLSNPAEQVDPPKAERRRPSLWSPADLAACLAALEQGRGGWYGPLFTFLLASGCRVGEALGLRWGDVDWQTGTVRIERQLVQVGRTVHEAPPKTRSGVRSLALPSFGLEALRRQRAAQAEARLRAGQRWQGSQQVFSTTLGGVPSRRNVLRALRALAAELELPRLRLHDLRHLNVSLLAMAGVPVRVAQQRAGHSSPTVTLAVYQHVLGDADRQAAEALERLLGGR